MSDSGCIKIWPLILTRNHQASGASVFFRFLRDESGATAIEYGLIASLIALAILGGVGGLADSLEVLWGDNNAAIGAALK